MSLSLSSAVSAASLTACVAKHARLPLAGVTEASVRPADLMPATRTAEPSRRYRQSCQQEAQKQETQNYRHQGTSQKLEVSPVYSFGSLKARRSIQWQLNSFIGKGPGRDEKARPGVLST